MGEIIRKEGKDMTTLEFLEKFGEKIRLEDIAKYEDKEEIIKKLYRKRLRARVSSRNTEQLVLLDKSARIGQFKDYELATVMVTRSDYFKLRHFKVDRVFDLDVELETDTNQEFIVLFPEKLFHGVYSEKRRYEIKEYCEMVAYQMMRNPARNLVLVYDDPAITEVLTMNNIL